MQTKRKTPRKHIMLPMGCGRRLAAMFKVSEITVHSAIYFATNSELANKIRHTAMQMGGQIYDPKNYDNGRASTI